MAEFLRPEARAALWRWREALGGLAIALLALWWLASFYAPVRWIGWAILALGVAATLGGIQRARFRQSGQGPGVVQIRERRLAYFGPLTGGIIDMDDVTRLELDPAARPAHWILSGIGGQSLEVPVNATGADDLFDLFATLPGIRTEAVLAALERHPEARVTIWSRPPVARRLH